MQFKQLSKTAEYGLLDFGNQSIMSDVAIACTIQLITHFSIISFNDKEVTYSAFSLNFAVLIEVFFIPLPIVYSIHSNLE